MKQLKIKHHERELTFDIENRFDLAIPMAFNGPQPNAYGVERASAKACEYGDLIGDTRKGGGCNFEKLELIPHCNGTHTESIGHITNERISVRECLLDNFFVAALISVDPTPRTLLGESISASALDDDPLISASEIVNRLNSIDAKRFQPNAIIIRSLPNSAEKINKEYASEIPPYFTKSAMELISENGFEQLLCDMPSIDRIYDSGVLENHRVFWGMPPKSFDILPASRINRTITEFIFVPDQAVDGIYLLDLQVAAFDIEAAPSRPIVFPLIK